MAHQTSELATQDRETLGEQRIEPTSRSLGGIRAGLTLWFGLVIVSVGWGTIAISSHKEFKVEAAPLFGHWDWKPDLGVLLIAATGVAAAVLLMRYSQRLPWRSLLVMSSAFSALWSVVLNVAQDGWSSLTARLTDRFQYEPLAASIHDAGSFLRGFVSSIGGYPVHVRGHPPGATLVPWMLDRVGLSGAGWFALLIIIGWGVAATSVIIATREVAGESVARRALPAAVLLPGALWATNADGLFAGVSALAIAVGVIAIVRRRYEFAIASGVLFALSLMLTYGAGPLFLVVVVVAAVNRDWYSAFRLLVVVALSAAAVLTLIWAISGFSWLEGMAATRREYWEGVGSVRPSVYFMLAGNPGALALAVGPAVFGGFGALAAQLPKLWRDRSWVAFAALPLAALVAVGAANASLLSKAEVERIWLMFMPWLAVSTAASGTTSRRLLWYQVGVSVVLAATFRR